MNKVALLVLLAVLLAACSPAARISDGEPAAAPYATSTLDDPDPITEDPILNSIQISLTSGPHGEIFKCADCHASVQERAGEQLIWHNPADGKTESVDTSNELCIKCHTGQSAATPVENSFQPAHADTGCTDCHNAHSTQAGCTQSACHSDIRTIMSAQVEQPAGHTGTGDPNTSYMCGGVACHDLARQVATEPIYHQPVHGRVPCYVCHDGSGMAVASTGGVTFMTVQAADGQPSVSHTITLEVDCSKCHYTDNPWNLIVISSWE